MVTRRVHKRQLLLAADPNVQQIIEYTLAYCMTKYNVRMHAIIVEGNHIHRVDTDQDAERPDFIRDFHALVARQINQYYKEGDALFSNKPTSIVDNQEANDIVSRIVYTMANPVADGIEREGKNHKGIRMRWPQPDKVIKRPVGFWRLPENGGVAPDEVTLHFSRPPGWEGMSDEELDSLIEKRVLALEKKEREKREAEGSGFLCDITDEPPSPLSYPKSPHRLFKMSPLIGATRKEARLAAIAALREFRRKHEAARLRKKAGEQGVVFPHGTYLAVKRWGVPVESPTLCACAMPVAPVPT